MLSTKANDQDYNLNCVRSDILAHLKDRKSTIEQTLVSDPPLEVDQICNDKIHPVCVYQD